jgi:hypothetical protein
MTSNGAVAAFVDGGRSTSMGMSGMDFIGR